MEYEDRSASKVSPAEPTPLARAVITVIGVSSAAMGVLSLVGATVEPIVRLRAASLSIENVPLGNAGIARFSGEMDGVTARYSTVNLELQDAPKEIARLDAGLAAIEYFPVILLSLTLCWLCWSATKGRPFFRTSPPMLGAAGVAIVLFDVLGSVLRGRLLAAVVEAAGTGGTAGDAGGGAIEGLAVGSSYGGLFFEAGVILVVLSAIFGLGSTMQRDTEQLV